jgi:hypothetical protein
MFLTAGLRIMWASPDLAHVIDAVRGGVQTGRAMTTMRTVYSTDRWFTFPRFHQTAEYLRDELASRGLKNVELIEAPADGTTQVGFWTMPLAWDMRSGRLEVLDDSVPKDQRKLADYAEVPSALGMWSGPTPPGGVIAELVRVKRGEAGRVDVRGKIAMTEENPANIKWLLVKGGALGAINTFTENPSLENGRQWINAWGDDGWAFTARSAPLLCFSVTPSATRLLDRLLARGPVRVRATIDSRYYNGSYPYVTGVVPGTGPEEVLTLGHAFEQGAQDNATGVAATVEAVTVLNELIEKGSLPRPARSIRILSMGEMYGSMHYVASNPDRIRRTIAAMCVDTPAASYDLAGTEYTFYMNPHVAKDFTDGLILKIAADYLSKVRRPWHEKPFTTGTDTYLAEPLVGIPTVWGYSGSGVETHHNSEDTPDRVDPRSLRDITIVTAAYLYYIASAGRDQAVWLAQLSESRGYGEILKTAERSIETGTGATDAVSYSVDRESQSVLSVLRLVAREQREQLRRELEPALGRLRSFGQLQLARVPASSDQPRVSPAAARIVVKRKRLGTIPLDDLPHEKWEGQPSGAWDALPTIALYWCDGRRNLDEVSKLTRLELGETDFDFVAYFRFLRKHGYVDFIQGE